ncbi:hypothetical protein E2C01_052970 [Portunus trituberculatus]|uniref:Uncharacterized protein n=1 Tax=Portunus trituberculatus TaxID=210409 RepID=A0A5B7GN97_PORTR|nr:hypothetical protein [Portunus trituberculatus]
MEKERIARFGSVFFVMFESACVFVAVFHSSSNRPVNASKPVMPFKLRHTHDEKKVNITTTRNTPALHTFTPHTLPGQSPPPLTVRSTLRSLSRHASSATV